MQAHAFSQKALAAQESYMHKYTDQFISCLRRESIQANGVIDMMKWVNFLTTDLIGDLSFGEPFGGLSSGELHPWLDTLFTTLKTFTFMREILRLPSFLVNSAMACIPKHMMEHQKSALAFGAEAARRRMERGSEKPDFMSFILKHSEAEGKGCVTLLILPTQFDLHVNTEVACLWPRSRWQL